MEIGGFLFLFLFRDVVLHGFSSNNGDGSSQGGGFFFALLRDEIVRQERRVAPRCPGVHSPGIFAVPDRFWRLIQAIIHRYTPRCLGFCIFLDWMEIGNFLTPAHIDNIFTVPDFPLPLVQFDF